MRNVGVKDNYIVHQRSIHNYFFQPKILSNYFRKLSFTIQDISKIDMTREGDYNCGTYMDSVAQQGLYFNFICGCRCWVC